MNFTQLYRKNRQRCQENKFIMLYGNYCYIFIENFSQKFSPCSECSQKKFVLEELANSSETEDMRKIR